MNSSPYQATISFDDSQEGLTFQLTICDERLDDLLTNLKRVKKAVCELKQKPVAQEKSA